MIPLGGAVETGAGKLPFKAIIHVAGISLLWRSSEWSVQESVRSALSLAEHAGIGRSPSRSSEPGSGGGKADRVLEWMLDVLQRIEFDGLVIVVQYKPVEPIAAPDRPGG